MLKTIIALALLTGGMSQAALAAPRPGVPQARVAVADLNLASAEGVARLDARIRDAAERVCPVPQGADLIGHIAAKTCRAQALKAAGEQRDRLVAAARDDSIRLASAAW